MKKPLSRRKFLKGAAACCAASAGSTTLLANVAKACTPNPRHVVCIYFDGGFDWLHWVIPTSADGGGWYQTFRPDLYAGAGVLRPIDGGTDWALHSQLANTHALYNAGRVAIIPQTHYVNRSGSHQASREQYLRGLQTRTNGPMETKGIWIRLSEAHNFPSRRCVVSVTGSDRMTEPSARALNLDNLSGFGFAGEADAENGGRVATAFEAISGVQGNDLENQLRDSWQAVEADSANVQAIAATKPDYPSGNSLANQLEEAEAIIRGFPDQSSCVYVRYGGHDTHGGQVNRNNTLISRFDTAVQEFLNSMSDMEDDVLVYVMSEFGRTNRQNNNTDNNGNPTPGTDHAGATCMFAYGSAARINGGIYSAPPTSAELGVGSNSLELKHNHVDVQWEIFQQFLGLPNVGGAFPGHTRTPIGFIA